jgi:uncharacterized protein YfaP (DUF2135 family)
LIGIGSHNTGYSPRSDGFQIVNLGSEYNKGGECFGMTSFSLWYFMHAKDHGDFYPRFQSQIGTTSDGKPILGQNVIATRAFTSIARQWTSYYEGIADAQSSISPDARYLAITNALINTGNPVLIYLSKPSSGTATHSVLAYGFNDLTNRIFIYDPNYPGEDRSIVFDAQRNDFRPYASGSDSFAQTTFNGDGSLMLSEDYQNILDDAEAGFHGSKSAQVRIDSPSGGETVPDRTVVIRGNIGSGQLLVTKLKVFVGSTPFAVDIDSSGDFQLPVNLERGVNHLTFRTESVDANGQVVLAPNNMSGNDFIVVLDAPQSMMLVTLTWDKNDSDVDLYVTDPTGETSWFQSKAIVDGGALDYDVTTGYGPEHWTLLSRDTIHYGAPYRVRLHYYSDHGNGPTNYTVFIKLYESSGRVQEHTYRGNLAVSDEGNAAPGSTGPDWVDIAAPVLSQ